MSAPALETRALSVSAGSKLLVRRADIALEAGGVLVAMGESGSGKSILAQAILGDLAPELAASGEVWIAGNRAGEDRRALWGRAIALLPQEPWTALDPAMRAGAQTAEVHALVRGTAWPEGRARARATFAELGLARDTRRFPFQLSGGMAQRAAIAATMAAGAGVLIADEPTKGLDADLRDSVAQALLAEAAKGNAVLAITHDAAFARALGGELIVMREADIVERGPTLATLDAPRHPYTRALVEADPERWPRATRTGAGPSAVAVEGLAARRGGRTLFAGLDFAVAGGEIVAVSGPSGCGKTTLGDVALGLLAPAAGRVARRPGVARSRFQKLYQDPVASFAPRATLRRSLADVAALFDRDPAGAEAELARLRVAPDVLDRRPDAVSGGELQRVALARALIADPIFLFADEATSRLDPPAQRATMELLRTAVDERNLALMIVTHDTALAEAMATRAPIRLG